MPRSADLICGEEWPSDGQTSYAYGQRKGGEQTLGCQQDHGILSDVVIPAFPLALWSSALAALLSPS